MIRRDASMVVHGFCKKFSTQHRVTRDITSPPGWDASLSQVTQHQVTGSITSPPGWDASPAQDTQHFVRSVCWYPYLYTIVKRRNVKQSFSSKVPTPIEEH